MAVTAAAAVLLTPCMGKQSGESAAAAAETGTAQTTARLPSLSSTLDCSRTTVSSPAPAAPPPGTAGEAEVEEEEEVVEEEEEEEAAEEAAAGCYHRLGYLGAAAAAAGR